MKIRIILPLFLILLVPPVLSLGRTWIVDEAGGPGVDFMDIPPALLAADPGDLVLVRNGTYSAVSLEKGLTLAADTGHSPGISGESVIGFIDAGQTAVLSGFQVQHLYLLFSQGRIVVDQCCNVYENGSYPQFDVADCDQVTISRCSFEASGSSYGNEEAIRIMKSTVVVSESQFIGAEGAMGYDYESGADGSPGMRVLYSTVYLQSSEVRGGKGGDYNTQVEVILWAGDGGPGLFLDDSNVYLFGRSEHTVESGLGGWSNKGTHGHPGNAVTAAASTLEYSGITFESHGQPVFDTLGTCFIEEVLPAVPVITLEGSGQLGGDIEPILYGAPGSSYVLLASPFEAVTPVGHLYSHLLLDPTLILVVAAGILPAGGSVSFPMHIPAEATDWQGLAVHFQGYLVSLFGQRNLSTAASFVVR